jgi:drug/metabolite transporter (DMT)-like permease
LIGTGSPVLLAGLLYLGAGLGIGILRRARSRLRRDQRPEAPLTRADLPWLAGAILAGGVIGPVLLMIGLARTEASSASLLLAFEGAATALMAWFIFREPFDRRLVAGMGFLVLAAALLAWTGQPTFSAIVGPLAIIGACVAWGLDNNLTRKVSLSDPLQIVELKGLIAGPFNIALGFLLGAELPDALTIAGAGLVGFLGYGASLALFIVALRHLGTARTGAYFSTAPFLGAVAAVIMLSEPVTWQLVGAGLLMAIGVWLHLTEHHEHRHVHATMFHDHAHEHDEHHRHVHAAGDPPGEPHSHPHRHAPLAHSHPHSPDMHHDHEH